MSTDYVSGWSIPDYSGSGENTQDDSMMRNSIYVIIFLISLVIIVYIVPEIVRSVKETWFSEPKTYRNR